MKPSAAAPTSIDEYIATYPPAVQEILETIRKTVQAAVPEATEGISYRMPVFKLGGVVIYFGAFKHHIGVFPPVSGDPDLVARLAPYAGEKGNLRFPLDEPMRYDLIAEIARLRAGQLLAKASQPRARGKKKSS
ncbi:MAG TPA: DUF1801 domain-containing protein [Thermoanaerobaculia bacterium]|nr:DUF1801 domain-containing protein [Thermoanaerobaculia bacterium]